MGRHETPVTTSRKHGPNPLLVGGKSKRTLVLWTNCWCFYPTCRYITVGCGAMKLILKNFGSVIKTNIDSPVTMGVDISREER